MIKGFGMVLSSVDFGWTLGERKTLNSKKVSDNIQISK